MYYLLPSSLKQSKLKLRFENEDEQSVSFDEFEPIRKTLIKCAFLDKSAHLLPVWRRFKGPFWDSLEFWVLPPVVQKRIEKHSLVLSPLYGFLSISNLIPLYKLKWESLCYEKKVKELWRPVLKEKSREIFRDKVIFNFLGNESRLLDFSTTRKTVEFEFYRKDKKVKSNARHKAYVLRYIAERDLDISQLDKINFYDYKVESILEEKNTIKVTMKSEGRYI